LVASPHTLPGPSADGRELGVAVLLIAPGLPTVDAVVTVTTFRSTENRS